MCNFPQKHGLFALHVDWSCVSESVSVHLAVRSSPRAGQPCGPVEHRPRSLSGPCQQVQELMEGQGRDRSGSVA